MTLSFVAYLERRLEQDPPKQKGLRTKERLKIAAAKLLGDVGYHALRVSDVSASAGLAEGSFYMYFKDKSDLTLQVLTQLLEESFDLEDVASVETTAFGATRASNRRWIALCRANAGLLRCVFQLGDEIPEFTRLPQRVNRQWYERVARAVVHRRGAEGVTLNGAMLGAYFLGAMMDEIVRKLIVYPDPDFLALLRDLKANDDDVADAATVVWLRILYPSEPIVGLTSPTAQAIALLVAGESI
jgi:TetR/AcrR family transcriptional repressor of nem operon